LWNCSFKPDMTTKDIGILQKYSMWYQFSIVGQKRKESAQSHRKHNGKFFVDHRSSFVTSWNEKLFERYPYHITVLLCGMAKIKLLSFLGIVILILNYLFRPRIRFLYELWIRVRLSTTSSVL
jgi:hypothetical protein